LSNVVPDAQDAFNAALAVTAISALVPAADRFLTQLRGAEAVTDARVNGVRCLKAIKLISGFVKEHHIFKMVP
jgi:hypothetical protein